MIGVCRNMRHCRMSMSIDLASPCHFACWLSFGHLLHVHFPPLYFLIFPPYMHAFFMPSPSIHLLILGLYL